MDIEETRWPGSDYKLIMDWRDRPVLRDLTKESYFLASPEEDTWPSSRLFKKLARIATQDGLKSVRLKKAELVELADQCHAFNRRTDSVIDDIHNRGLKPWQTEAEAQARYDRGEYAGVLALKIDEYFTVNSSPEEIDAEVRELLGGHLSDKE